MFLSQTNFSLHYSDKINAYNRKIVLVIFSPTLFIVEPFFISNNDLHGLEFLISVFPFINGNSRFRDYFQFTFVPIELALELKSIKPIPRTQQSYQKTTKMHTLYLPYDHLM